MENNEIIEETADEKNVVLEENASLDEVAFDETEELENKKAALESEIAALKEELERSKSEVDRKAKEYAEFKELFPHVGLDRLDAEVTAMTEAGVPLAAAYALYEKRLAVKIEAAKAHNEATRSGGFGSVGKNTAEEFYTPAEVRAMTQTEVRKNYQKILRSMENWH